jgi:hypothetical protein
MREIESFAFPLASAPDWISPMTLLARSPSASIVWTISPVACLVSLARIFTSCATMPKVLPASPARRASMAALSARMSVVWAIASMSAEQRRTCSIAAPKSVTCPISASTSFTRLPISPSEDWIIEVPSPSRSIARDESRRASSLASVTARWSASISEMDSCSAACSARRRPDDSMTCWRIPVTSEQPTVTSPQLCGMISSAVASPASNLSCFIPTSP